ncbi:MAG: gfo/Idh/MocA family oxidoreductase, partial [Gammaproteobacteria bacterium]|nr:gfo/Idh/MocA family oxidoreductase [Gammaproteobacteria bacterium]
NIGELGVEKNRANYGSARASLNNSEDEIVDKMQRRYEGLDTLPQPITNEHFGPVIVFCENGDIRLTPNSLELYENEKRRVVPCNYNFVRESFCNALVDTVRRNQPPPQNGQWGLASLEICHAILHSDKSGAMIALQHQQTKAQATQL